MAGTAPSFIILVGGEQPLHQFGKIVGFRADIMNELLLVGNRLPDVILVCPVIRIPETGIDDAVLHVDQERLLAKILVLRHLQQADEFLCPGGAWLDVFDLE